MNPLTESIHRSESHANYLRAPAFPKRRKPAEAVAEFTEILDYRRIANRRDARAYALQGDTAKAHAIYEDFPPSLEKRGFRHPVAETGQRRVRQS